MSDGPGEAEIPKTKPLPKTVEQALEVAKQGKEVTIELNMLNSFVQHKASEIPEGGKFSWGLNEHEWRVMSKARFELGKVKIDVSDEDMRQALEEYGRALFRATHEDKEKKIPERGLISSLLIRSGKNDSIPSLLGKGPVRWELVIGSE